MSLCCVCSFFCRWSVASTSSRLVWRRHRGRSQWTDAWSSSCFPIQPMTEDSGTCWLTSSVGLQEVHVEWLTKLFNYTITKPKKRHLSHLTEDCFKMCLNWLCLQKSTESSQRNAFQSHTAQRPHAEWMTSLIIRCVYTYPSVKTNQAHPAVSHTITEAVLTIVFVVLRYSWESTA